MAKAHGTPNGRDVQGLAKLLDSPEIANLIAGLNDTRWTGRPGYPMRTMVGIALVKSLYALPTWTRTVRLVAEHDGLRQVLGGCPSLDACYRFTRKLREHDDLLQAAIESVLAGLRAEMPALGTTVAIDGSDLPAYANGQRYVNNRTKLERTRYSDPDATWGHRSAISTQAKGSYYGYKVHAAVDTTTGLPVAWQVETASKLRMKPLWYRTCWTDSPRVGSSPSTPSWTAATT